MSGLSIERGTQNRTCCDQDEVKKIDLFIWRRAVKIGERVRAELTNSAASTLWSNFGSFSKIILFLSGLLRNDYVGASQFLERVRYHHLLKP